MVNRIFDCLTKISDEYYLNYVKTNDYYSISGIKTPYILKDIITLLSFQNEFEVFIETERNVKDDTIFYSISGVRKN